jgi:hypothetical protein
VPDKNSPEKPMLSNGLSEENWSNYSQTPVGLMTPDSPLTSLTPTEFKNIRCDSYASFCESVRSASLQDRNVDNNIPKGYRSAYQPLDEVVAEADVVTVDVTTLNGVGTVQTDHNFATP